MAVPTHPRRLSVAAVALAALLGVAWPALGRDSSPAGSGQAADSPCALLTAKEVSTAVGEKMAVVATDPTGCSFGATKNESTPTAVTNFSHCNVADEEIRAARIATDPAKQLALWKTAQDKIIKAVCAVPVYEQLQLWAWKDNLDLGYEVQGSLNLSPPVTEKARFTK